MSLVVVGPFLGQAEIDWEQGLRAVESLGLLIEGEHHGSARRIQVQADVGDLLGKASVPGQFERALLVRFQIVLALINRYDFVGLPSLIGTRSRHRAGHVQDQVG